MDRDYSTDPDDIPVSSGLSFHWSDYVIFGVFLALYVGIGVYQAIYNAFFAKKAEDTAEFLVGSRSMSIVPVALSLLSAFLSAILILGTPAEIYTQGTQYWMYVFGQMLSCIFATLLFVPMLYPLQLTSSYELLYIGVALYSPATALYAVTGFEEWLNILIGGLVAIIYTALGGMKAAVWTSAVQSVLMAAGVLAVIIKGSVDMGGIGHIWRRNVDMQRIEFFNFDTSPLTRHSFWTLIVGGLLGWLSTYGVNQASVQRYCSVPTLKAARIVVLLNIPGLLFFMTICCLSGIVIFAWYDYVGCDPLKAGIVKNSNQLIPYYVLDRLGYPCVPGIFLACLFAGALSSVSSSLGALAAVIWEDILKHFMGHLSVTIQTLTTKLLVVLFGGVGIGMAFMCQSLGGTVLQMSLSFTGAASGPILGLFVLGGCFPCANWLGAVIGGLVGLAFPLWISIGAYDLETYSPALPSVTHNCTNFTEVFLNETMLPPTPDEVTGLSRLYLVSYLWFSPIGTFTVVVVGLIVSIISGLTDPGDLHEKYHLPFFDRIICCLPNKSLYILRCKYEEYDSDRAAAEEEKPEEKLDGSLGGSNAYTNIAYDQEMNGYGMSYKKTSSEFTSF